MAEEFLMVHDVAKLVDRTGQTVRDWEREGKLPAIRTPSGVRLFKASDVNAFAATLGERKRQAE